MRRLSDAFVQAVQGIVRNGLVTFVSIFVLISCLLFVGSFALLARNISYNMEDFRNLNEIEVFLYDDATKETVDSVGSALAAYQESGRVIEVTFVSKAEGLEEMKGEFSEYGELLDDIDKDENPLPDKFRVVYADNKDAVNLDAEIRVIPGVHKVNSRLDIAAKVSSLENGISIIFVWFIILCTVVCMFVIINTIKLSVYSRREEITIMRYIGASRAYIAAPFVLEGMLIGTVGALAAFFIEKGIYAILCNFVSAEMGIVKLYTYGALSPMLLLLFFGVALVCGVVGSLVSLGKYVEA